MDTYPVSPEIEKKIIDLEKFAAVVGSMFPQVLSILLPGPGTVVAIMSNAMMSYIRNRHEANISILLQELKDRVADFENSLKEYTNEDIRILKEDIFPLICDYSADEVQKEKIKMFVNGFEYAVKQKLLDQENFLEFVDTLKALRLRDISVFQTVRSKSSEDKNVLKRPNIDRLVMLNLVHVRSSWQSLEGNTDYIATQINVTDFGDKFYYFIQREASCKVGPE